MSALPHQLVWQARRIAEQHALRVVDVTDTKRDRKTGDLRRIDAWVVYRTNVHAARSRIGARLCKTTKPQRLLELVRKAAGVDAAVDTVKNEPAGAHAHR